MAFKQVNRGDTIDIKKGEIGKEYIGTFTGHKVIPSPLGQQVIWQFRDEEDKAFGIWGFTNLNFQMENVKVDSLCRLSYQGQSKIKNKYGKFPYQAKVEVNEEEDIEFPPAV